MTRTNIIKLTLALLLAAAVALGIYRSNRDPLTQRGHISNTGIAADKSLNQYFREAQQLSDTNAAAVATTTVSFFAGGDIMLSRNVALAIKKSGDTSYPFREMENILKSTDFNFANLESPIYFNPKNSRDETSGIIGGHSLVFGAPSENIYGLLAYNFKIVNLANNHALDQEVRGLDHTIQILNQLGIQHIGVGSLTSENPLADAWKAGTVEIKGIKICFIGASYASINDNGKTTNAYVARIEDLDRLKFEIGNLKLSCDFIVATMHAGTEYTRKPNAAQIKFAHAAIDYGADMVIGAHPHWVQTIERYCPGSFPSYRRSDEVRPLADEVGYKRGLGGDIACANPKYIVYSLGNFVFDQDFSQDTKEGLGLKIQISKVKFQSQTAPGAATMEDLQGPRKPAALDSVELIPLIIENAQPRPANEAENKRILDKIGEVEKILK